MRKARSRKLLADHIIWLTIVLSLKGVCISLPNVQNIHDVTKDKV
jgi:hypothetical protein